ncbi:MAG TPA: LD-carboxypeptidase [Bacillota bacterium]|nr:LD-carboxypeptidase [Bacillota bacterium]
MNRCHRYILWPKALPSGGTIGIIAPASPAAPERIREALQVVQQLGFQYKLGRSVFETHGYLAGEDALRANDVNQMFADPEVDAIFCLRGGYGTPRILDQIDYECIRYNPKIFVGYSDITALHIAIHQRTGLITFHGPMIAELADQPDPLTWPTLFQHLMLPEPFGRYTTREEMFQYTITPGVAQGRLIGGNLCLLVSSLGTPFELKTKGRILFIEDVGEAPYSIDRMLTQLKYAGKLQEASGIVLADFSGAESKEGHSSLTLQQVFQETLSPLGVPCYFGLKSGHCQPNLTLPIGVKVRIHATEGWIETLEGGVR